MKIAIACDHAGFSLKQHLSKYLKEQGHEVVDLGVDTDAVPTDYPDAAKKLGDAVVNGVAERGILSCGSGVGASIAANKIKGVYCGLCHDAYSAAQGVRHDNMNVLALGGRVIGVALAEALVDAFLAEQFDTETERYGRRFNLLKAIESAAE